MLEPKPFREEDLRIQVLKEYDILDSPSEEDFDQLTKLASCIADTPISLVSIVDSDRQWFKSRVGLGLSQGPRATSFCGHAIHVEAQDIFIVEDATMDDRFKDNPLVTDDPNIVFYAGVPLYGKGDMPLGTLCVIDRKPKVLSDKQINQLKTLANQVMLLLELRLEKKKVKAMNDKLRAANEDLKNFAFVAAHDLKSPIHNISTLIGFIQSEDDEISDDLKYKLELIQKSSNHMAVLIDRLLEHRVLVDQANTKREWVELEKYDEYFISLLGGNNDAEIHFKSDLDKIYVNTVALDQVLLNLVTNSIKYCDKDKPRITIRILEKENEYHFEVEDNGPGIHPDFQAKMFKLFEIGATKDRFGNKGTGIGLSTVHKMVEGQEGEIRLKSSSNQGSTFHFTFRKLLEMPK